MGKGCEWTGMHTDIDVTFDVRRDTPKGKDPDTHSQTLRRYHRMLWSKPLPSGSLFALDDTTPGCYLHHKSAAGEFFLSSDSVIPTYSYREDILSVTSADALEAFDAIGYTIGGMMVFPAFQIDRRWTINQARGCNRLIADRFDLTLECIRRHYGKGASPLSNVLDRYADFFGLFQDFRGYVEFFLLQDLVTPDCSAVKLAPPSNNFSRSPVPSTVDEYQAYREASVAFVEARNKRILRTQERVA
jgi:hypothetical protein